SALISKDGTESYMAAYMKPISDDQASDAAKRIRDTLSSQPVKVGGADAVGDEVGTIIGEDLAKAEMLAFPIIFLLSLWVFRGVIAALLPSLMGGVVIFRSSLSIRCGARRRLRLVPGDRPPERGDDPLRLRPQPGDRPEPRPRHRLQPAH